MSLASGYPIAAEALDLELYVLAALIGGSQGIQRRVGRFPALRQLRSTFELSELSRRLIAVAVALRSALDASHTTAAPSPGSQLGTLVPDVSKPGSKQTLGFREACNKIIHAEVVDFFPRTPAEDAALTGRVRLRGTKGNKEWLAELDVFAFISNAHRIS